MALDARRNQAYLSAMQGLIGPETVVLDIGAGTGVLGLMAARLGARRVYLVDPEDVIAVAAEVALANGLEGRVHCLHGRMDDVQVPERVDVILSVLTGNFLLTEDLLDIVFRARDQWLKPGGALLPQAAVMEIAPVTAAALHEAEIAAWAVPQGGVDLGTVRGYAANTVFYPREKLREARPLAEPSSIRTIDFHDAGVADVHADVTCDITVSGICHGIAGWFRMRLGEHWLSTSPMSDPMHWSAAFLPLDPPIALERGERLGFSLDRPNRGDWTWCVRRESTGDAQVHSTLFAMPITAESLAMGSLEYAPSLNPEGDAMANVLALCDGTRSVATIAHAVRSTSLRRFRDQADAVAFVQRVIRRLSVDRTD